ncbi:uncharacterized protein LOC120134738 [Hibiscus syriacus]|uniref:uncharacterized protein LOC120134738 n=1 Tax=Hibiscus syriacus TaxID=106335 RepID=UPI001920DEF0|nr:uncharacterized protein LOC120134738 [Hibiscus syriacus]
MDWRKLFGNNTGQSLNFYPPSFKDGIPTINPPAEIIEAGISEWKFSLVGQFLGPAPNFMTMQRIVDQLWAKASHNTRVQVSLAGSNLYIFSFASKSVREWVLENGPWHIINKPLILRKWEPNLKRLSFDISKIPIWVHLYNIPLELFSQAGLSYIASGIGIPISMDSVTASKSMLEFAKVCVEIGVNDEIPKSVGIVLQDGQYSSVYVEIPWLPPRCKKCKIFGHKNCLVKISPPPLPTQVWKKKESSSSNSNQGEMEAVQEQGNPNPKETPHANENLPGSTLPSDISIPNSTPPEKSHYLDVSIALNNITTSNSSVDSVLKNYIEPLSSTVVEPHIPKRGKGRPPKEKNTLVGSMNRFELLNSIDEAPLVKMPLKEKSELLPRVLLNWINLWLNLHDLDRGFGRLPWILGGDFNFTLHPNESSDYELLCPFSSPDMKEFQFVTQYLDLHDHPFFGPLFTWSNKQTDSYLARKLDRILINSNWANSFSFSFVEFLSPGVSNHRMGIIWFIKDTPSDRPKLFKFFNFWTRHPNFLKVVEQSWQIAFQGVDTIDKELQVQQELHNLEEVELLFLKQKAKIHWIKDGDKCSNFFHSAVAVKNKIYTIRMLIDDQGTRLETFDAMSSEVIDFFSNLIGKVDPMVKGENLQFLKELLNYISTETDSSLTKPVTSEEIKEAIFDQGNNKAPGPDGYSPQFFKHSWPIIGEDMVAAIKHFFHHSTMLPAFNATTIVLVPKIPNPSKVKDFKPISCCSVIYKTISKILVKRLSACFTDARFSIAFNGSLIGYFKGARGIRQGDPLSPLLYVISMNVLSRLLNLAAAKNLISFHPKCKRICLTHLSFADDLMIFCKGNVDSVIGVISVLEQFYEMSGLNLNA